MMLRIKKSFVFHDLAVIELQLVISIAIFAIIFNTVYTNHTQERNTTEIISKHDHFNINTIIEIGKNPTLRDIVSLKVNMNASYVEPTEITLQPIMKLDNGISYKVNSITKTTIGFNQTLNHQFFIPLKYLGNNRITLLITDSNNPNETVEIDTTFDTIKVIK
jgi:hypothetical protein